VTQQDSGKRDRTDQATDSHHVRHDRTVAAAEQSTATPTLPPAGWYPDPALARTLRYWDGNAWTGRRAPATGQATHSPPPGAVLGADERPDEMRFVWLIALLPVLWLPFDYFMPDFSLSTPAAFASFVLTGALAQADAAKLLERGVRVRALWGWLFPPVYLILRTKRARSTVAIPLVYFAGLAVSLAGALTFAATYELTDSDIDRVERSLESRNGLDIVTVTCPDELVAAGDRIWCTVRGGGDEVRMPIDFSTSGLDFIFTWRAVQLGPSSRDRA
jgi:hypothetical protein